MQEGQLSQHTRATESLMGSIRVMERKLTEAKGKKETLKVRRPLLFFALQYRLSQGDGCEWKRLEIRSPLFAVPSALLYIGDGANALHRATRGCQWWTMPFTFLVRVNMGLLHMFSGSENFGIMVCALMFNPGRNVPVMFPFPQRA